MQVEGGGKGELLVFREEEVGTYRGRAGTRGSGRGSRLPANCM